MTQGKTKRPFYRNMEDTLEDVGISKRQLSYWLKQGLFDPELGSQSKFFTEGDTAQLHFLKRMIVDLGLAVATVQRLFAAAAEDYDEGDLFSMPTTTRTFIDVKNSRLVYPPDAMSELVADAIVGAKPWRTERLFDSALLLVLQNAWSRARNPDVYEAHVKAIHDRVDRVDLLQRLRYGEKEHPHFWPKRESDPVLTSELAKSLLAEKKSLEAEINEAQRRRTWA